MPHVLRIQGLGHSECAAQPQEIAPAGRAVDIELRGDSVPIATVMAHRTVHQLVEMLDQLAAFGIEAVDSHAGQAQRRRGLSDRGIVRGRPDQAVCHKHVGGLVMVDRHGLRPEHLAVVEAERPETAESAT